MASLPNPKPPCASGSVKPNTPSSPSLAISSCGMYSFWRCHSCACGSTSASAKRRICSRISDSVSSRPVSPKVVTAGCAAIRLASFDLRPSAVPASIRSPTSPSKRRELAARHAEGGEPHRLVLAHGDAAGDLCEVFAEGGGEDQPLHIAEPSARTPGAAPSPASGAATPRRWRAKRAHAPRPARHRCRPPPPPPCARRREPDAAIAPPPRPLPGSDRSSAGCSFP